MTNCGKSPRNFKGMMLLFLLTSLTGGCQPATSPQSATDQPRQADQTRQMEYAKQYQGTMLEFQQAMVALTSRPIPKLPKGTPKEKRREIIARNIDDIVQADTRFIARLDALTPPPELRRIHDATRNMLVTTRKGNAGFASAIRQGSRTGVEKNRLESAQADKAALQQMAEAARRTAKDPSVIGKDAQLLTDEAKRLTEAAKNLTP